MMPAKATDSVPPEASNRTGSRPQASGGHQTLEPHEVGLSRWPAAQMPAPAAEQGALAQLVHNTAWPHCMPRSQSQYGCLGCREGFTCLMRVWVVTAACSRTLLEQPLPLGACCSTSPSAWPLGSCMQWIGNPRSQQGFLFKTVSNAEEVG